MTVTDSLTAALVIITAIYAWATFKILRVNQGVVSEMRRQLAAAARPYVVIYPFVRVGTQIICLTVRNTGRSPALNLRLAIDRDFFQFGDTTDDKNLAKFSAFTQAIDSFAPGADLLFYLGVGHELFGRADTDTVCPRVFTITTTYSSADESFSERNSIDLRPYVNSAVPQHPIVEELERLRKSLDQLTKATGKHS